MADYPITAVARRVVYSGSAGTGPYNFSFPVLTSTDIDVYQDSTKLTLTTDYTVSVSATDGTGSVTLGSAASGSNTITIVGARALQRTTDFVTAGDLLASSLNTELDSQTIFVQQASEDATRAIKAPVTDPTSINMELPAKASRLGKLLGFDSSTGNPEATTGRVNTVTVSGVSVGGDPTATFTDSTGALALGIPVGATGATGSAGSAGADGAPSGLNFTWSSSTSDADPGTGKIAFNHATLSSVSKLYIADETADSGNPNVSTYLLSWDDSTNTALRGTITVVKKSAQQNFAVYNITGAAEDDSGFVSHNVTHVVSNGSFTNLDAVYVNFVRTGNAGSLSDPTTTRGDLLFRNSSGNIDRLAIGSGSTVLIGGTDPSYSTVTNAMLAGSIDLTSKVTGALPLSNGGTGQTSLSAANIVVTNAQQTFTKAQVPSTYTAALSATSGVLDFDTYQNFIITLAAGSNTLAAPTTEASQVGQCGVIIFIQPGSGSAATLSLHADYETAAAAGITLSSANDDYDVCSYVIKGDNSLLISSAQLNFG